MTALAVRSPLDRQAKKPHPPVESLLGFSRHPRRGWRQIRHWRLARRSRAGRCKRSFKSDAWGGSLLAPAVFFGVVCRQIGLNAATPARPATCASGQARTSPRLSAWRVRMATADGGVRARDRQRGLCAVPARVGLGSGQLVKVAGHQTASVDSLSSFRLLSPSSLARVSQKHARSVPK
jgi:hypothetical protein